eukprot:4873703-Karenia_brevis.AAC.1
MGDDLSLEQWMPTDVERHSCNSPYQVDTCTSECMPGDFQINETHLNAIPDELHNLKNEHGKSCRPIKTSVHALLHYRLRRVA